MVHVLLCIIVVLLVAVAVLGFGRLDHMDFRGTDQDRSTGVKTCLSITGVKLRSRLVW